MTYNQQKSTGRSYTPTVAFAAIGLIFVPVVVLFAGPVRPWALVGAGALALAFFLLAWMTWRQNSELTIPTIEPPYPDSK